MSAESTQKLKVTRTHSTLRRSRAHSDASYIHINMNLLWLFFWYEDPALSLSLDLTEAHTEKIRVECEYPGAISELLCAAYAQRLRMR